ncbi:MAG: DUF29 domain-containing protein [Chromatiaceae bacterium]|nr:DUF29 domain-containing protein [Chromatiaceae bacterium]
MHSQLRETDDTTAAYDADYFLWLQETRGQLARRDFAGVDLMHLLEEIDDLSRREQRTLKHLLRQLLAHLLKLVCSQPVSPSARDKPACAARCQPPTTPCSINWSRRRAR